MTNTLKLVDRVPCFLAVDTQETLTTGTIFYQRTAKIGRRVRTSANDAEQGCDAFDSVQDGFGPLQDAFEPRQTTMNKMVKERSVIHTIRHPLFIHCTSHRSVCQSVLPTRQRQWTGGDSRCPKAPRRTAHLHHPSSISLATVIHISLLSLLRLSTVLPRSLHSSALDHTDLACG